jgi:exodeoxyribonuclease V alpha subunit
MEQIRGYVERITFQSPETGYTVAQLHQVGKSALTCIVGTMPSIQPGETLVCEGSWKKHAVHGLQFEVTSYRTEMPADVVGIAKYLGSGLVRGIGPVYAKRIVGMFGTATLEVIDREPEKLRTVSGIGKGRLEKIKACWSDQRAIRDVMIFLQTYGVSPTYAQKIFRQYGAESIAKVSENPYRLARDIHGIGFKTADVIAQKLGVAADAPQRLDAGIEFVLFDLSNEGHVCFPLQEFIPAAEAILTVSQGLIQERLTALQAEGRVVAAVLGKVPMDQPFVWLVGYFEAEQAIARDIKRLLHSHSALRSIAIPRALAWVQETLRIQLAEKQLEAVGRALVDKVQIITGGPGTGKSTISNAILRIMEKLTEKIVLAAPTGRAAKRMSEITGKKASTIHSLLEFDFRKMQFKRNRRNPLDCDLLIIDESSMIDTSLMSHLLKAVPDHARVVFVGDINQLPSVGPGNVLKDLIGSRMLPVTQLNEIYRQAAGSRIITNAHRINDGVMPNLDNDPTSDFFFIEAQEPEEILKVIVELVSERLVRRYPLHRLDDIQVLAPMRRGVIGTDNLNIALQEALNPKGTSYLRFGQCYRVGDKVMQIRNDYDKGVFNGDVGRIEAISAVDQQMAVVIDERTVLYDFSDLDDLVLAYAVSIHKYQGSECPCIIIPVHTTHFKLLHRNLLYTGVTRGKRLVVLVGTKRAVAIALKNDEVRRRYTGLRQALRGERAALSQPVGFT